MSDAFDWWAVAGLVLAPLLLLALMPRSRVRELWLRGYLGVLLIGAGLSGCLVLLLPLLLPPDSHFLHGWRFFSVLSVLLLMLSAGLVLLLPPSNLKTMLGNGLLWLAGAVALVLAAIGAVLPVMPTVPFLLITFTCWAKASPRFKAWLYRHPRFGKMMRDWQEKRAIPRRGKYMAWGMMSLSCVGLLIRFPERWYVGASVGVVCLCVGIYMARFPDA